MLRKHEHSGFSQIELHFRIGISRGVDNVEQKGITYILGLPLLQNFWQRVHRQRLLTAELGQVCTLLITFGSKVLGILQPLLSTKC